MFVILYGRDTIISLGVDAMEKTKILVVEDEQEIGDAIEIYLKTQGYEVVQARNGAIGLDYLQKGEFSLALVDVMMPVMDGITMIKKCREMCDIPIIILSGRKVRIWIRLWA